MYQEIYKYFVLNRKISIPGIGNFSVNTDSAKLDFVTGVLHAPQPKVAFEKGQPAIDRQFFQYLSKALNVDEKQAVQSFQAFSQSIKENIDSNKPVELPGIGKLQKGYSDDDILFTEEQTATTAYLNDIKLSSATDSKANLVELYKTGDNLIITEETEDDRLEMIIKEKDEDYWWVYALILALMGVGALLYYYI
jgi:nucleoid DNA-binding protein